MLVSDLYTCVGLYINIWTHVHKQLPKFSSTSAPPLPPALFPVFLKSFLYDPILLSLYPFFSTPFTPGLNLHPCHRSVPLDQLGCGLWPLGLFPFSSTCLMINSACQCLG